jgi:hypothetical protein
VLRQFGVGLIRLLLIRTRLSIDAKAIRHTGKLQFDPGGSRPGLETPVRIRMAHWVWKPFLLLTAAGAIAGVVAFLQIPPPVSTRVTAAPAGIPKMQLLRDEHETMRAFLAEQAARMRMAAAVESEPGPDEATALAEAELEPAIPTIVAASKQTPTKPVRIVRASARSPLSILPPPANCRRADAAAAQRRAAAHRACLGARRRALAAPGLGVSRRLVRRARSANSASADPAGLTVVCSRSGARGTNLNSLSSAG